MRSARKASKGRLAAGAQADNGVQKIGGPLASGPPFSYARPPPDSSGAVVHLALHMLYNINRLWPFVRLTLDFL